MNAQLQAGPRRGLRLAVVTLVIAVVIAGAVRWTSAEFRAAKDSRDLHDLTKSIPFARSELLVPDAASIEDASGIADAHGFEVYYRADPTDARSVSLKFRMHRSPADGSFDDEALRCDVVKIYTCTTLENGLIRVVTHDTDNSDPALALYQQSGDRVVSVTGYGGPVDLDRLRNDLLHTHRPTDAELLELLRPDGYETDWS